MGSLSLLQKAKTSIDQLKNHYYFKTQKEVQSSGETLIELQEKNIEKYTLLIMLSSGLYESAGTTQRVFLLLKYL